MTAAVAARQAPHRSPRALRWLAWGFATLAVVGLALETQQFTGATVPWEWVQNGSFALALVLAGGLLVRASAARAVGSVLLLSGAAQALSIFCQGLGNLALDQGSAAATGWHLAAEVLWPLFIVPPLTLLPLLFPSGAVHGPVWRAVAALAVVTTGWLMLITLTAADISTGNPSQPTLLNPLRVSSALSTAMIGAGQALGALVSLASLVGLALKWRRGPRLVRQQITLLTATLTLTLLWMLVGDLLPGSVHELGTTLWPLLTVAAIAVAVLRYELWDLQLVLKRVALYSALTAGLSAVFLAAYLAALAVASRLSAPTSSWSAAAVGALVVVLCAEPGRRRLQQVLERWLLGERRRPLVAAARLRDVMASGTDAVVMADIAETVASAVRSPGAELALQDEGHLAVVATAGGPVRDAYTVPLLHRGERLGEIRVDRRSPGEEYHPQDRALLLQLADQAAGAVYGRRRDAELAAARQDAITMAAEERARLGRDLHDGLAPLLAGAGLAAEALRRGLPPGSADERDAARLAERLRTAAGETRRYAHDLQPGPLAQSGLGGALTEYVRELRGPDLPGVTVTADVGPLPAALEQTIYFCVLEAVTNAVRHAAASHVAIAVTQSETGLTAVVEDDGAGLDEPYISGIGLTSMRRRAQALGGTFTISPATPRGTRVRVSIPVPG